MVYLIHWIVSEYGVFYVPYQGEVVVRSKVNLNNRDWHLISKVE